MRLSNIRSVSGAVQAPAQIDAGGVSSPSAAAFARAIEHRRIVGSPAHTMFGVGLLILCLVDLARGGGGHGGVASMVVALVGGVLPDRARGAGVGAGLLLALQAGALLWSSTVLLNSPWRRWLRPALHRTVPFWSGMQRILGGGPTPRGAIAELAADAILSAALFIYALPIVALSGRVLAGGALLGIIAALIFALGGTWVIRALLSRISHAGDLASGDRDTLLGIGGSLFVSVLVSVTSPTLFAALVAFAPSVGALERLRLGEFYLLIGALGLVLVQYFSTQTDGAVEVLYIDPADRALRIPVPDCTRGDFKSFRFQVQPNGRQVVLLAAEPRGAQAYRVCTTLDDHEATTARYEIINLTEIQSRLAPQLKLQFSLLNDHFNCTLDLNIFTRSPEAFISQLRGAGVSVPLQDFSLFSDTLLATNRLQSVLAPAFESTVAGIVSRLDGEPNGGRSDFRARGDTLRMAAQDAKATFRDAVARYQTSLRSVYERASARESDLYGRLKGGMDQTMAQFDQAFAAGRRQFYGQGQLEALIKAHYREGGPGLADEPVRWRGQGALAGSSQLLFALLQLRVTGVSVVASPRAAPVDDTLLALHDQVHQAHQEALDEMRRISERYGERFDEPINRALESPTTPYATRAQILGGQLSRLSDAEPPLSGPSASRLQGADPGAGEDTPAGVRRRLSIRQRSEAEQPLSPTAARSAGAEPSPRSRPAGPADEPF